MSSSPATADEATPNHEWLSSLRAAVPPTTFKKGREYAEARRVSLLSVEPERICANVQGALGAQYSVELRLSGRKLDSTCTCPAWNKYGSHCKHVVAVALTTVENEQGPLAASSSILPVRPSLPSQSKVENWLGLSTLPDMEFLYRLTGTQPASLSRTWVLDVRRQDAQSKGPVNVRRALSAGTRLALADERIFVELAKHEMRYDARILISDEELCDLVELLRPRRVIYRGAPLAFSSQAAQVQVQVESQPGCALARLGLRLPDGARAEFKEVVVLIGRQNYVIVGQTIFPMQPNYPPRLMRKWLLEPTMNFPPTQLDKVLTFFAAHLPRFELPLASEGVAVEERVAPRFVVTLEGDEEGVRAQLAARYGQATVPVSPGLKHLGYAGSFSPDAQGGPRLYLRDAEAERAAGQVLIDCGLKFDVASSAFVASGDGSVDFWLKGYPNLPREWERYGAVAPKVRIRSPLKPRIRLAMSGIRWFELDAEFSADDQQVDLGAIRLWLNSGRRFIRLGDGSLAEGDRSSLEPLVGLLEEAGALPGKRHTRLAAHQAAALELVAQSDKAVSVDPKARRFFSELREREGIPPAPPSKQLRGVLRHYQESGLSWLWFLHQHGLSGILADDMGLGKTVQTLALLLKAREEEGKSPSLVIAPTSVLTNWEREVERFTPQLKVAVWHGQGRKELAAKLEEQDIVVTSYALVRKETAALSRVSWRYVILDEAQYIKNADSATAQACKVLPAQARLALTGTPVENRLSELWSIFDFLMPGFLGSASEFAERYEPPSVAPSPEGQERLRRKVRPFILRRLKDEVAKDLPPKTETIAYCEMEPSQAALYREILEQTRRKVFDSIERVGFNRSRFSILAALMRLRQVCCDPKLLKLPAEADLPPSAKWLRFWELVDDLVAEGHRALIFSQFVEMLSLMTAEADRRNLKYLYLDGRTRDRMARVDQFNAPDGPPIFFISLKAGGTGLNLTAADYVLHYDPWWNPAVEAQATDRTHRIGQKKAVISYKLIVRGTVEEKMLSLQQAKKSLAEGVLGSDSSLGKVLTESDVEALLKAEP